MAQSDRARLAVDIGGTFTDVVAQGPDGRIETRCVPFEEEVITGADLLDGSGLEVLEHFAQVQLFIRR